MKKIMFNDKYGLTQAVLEGRKTMTRRLVQSNNIVEITTSDGVNHHVDGTCGSYHEYKDKDGKAWLAWSPYKVGDILAIAQSYKNLNELGYLAPEWLDGVCEDSAGYTNKMFVRADLMPHRIRITNIRLERLQDISDEDCIKEGIIKKPDPFIGKDEMVYDFEGSDIIYCYPKTAFADLIDKVSKKGTWERNPFVFAYSFELID